MSEKIYLNLLILCGILSQQISGSSLEDNHGNSSNLHVRQKRMIGHTFLRHGDWLINDVIHIVKIFKEDEKICTGVIVTPAHILIPKKCVSNPPTMYRVESGAPRMGPIKTHQIVQILRHDFLSLLFINPLVTSGSRLSRPILPAVEAVPEDIHPTIIAWGPTGQVRPIMQVELAEWIDCAFTYMHHTSKYPITQLNICTVQPNEVRNRCATEDRGAALVVGDRLFGVLVRAGSFDPPLPNIFLLVNNGNEYYRWLMQYIDPYSNSQPHLYSQEP